MKGNDEPELQFNDPAWVKGQKAAWPIVTTHIDVFGKAERVAPKPDCMSVKLGQGLGGGKWACHAPAATFPSCPSGTPGMISNETSNTTMLSSSDSDGMESGAV